MKTSENLEMNQRNRNEEPNDTLTTLPSSPSLRTTPAFWPNMIIIIKIILSPKQYQKNTSSSKFCVPFWNRINGKIELFHYNKKKLYLHRMAIVIR